MNTKQAQSNNESPLELKRCISRLSYIGMGLSRELDKALEELRASIKSDADDDQVKKDVDQISKILLTLEDNSESQRVEVASSEVDLLQLLLEKKLPNKLKSELRRAHNNAEQKDAIHIVDSIVTAIQNFFNDLDVVKEVAQETVSVEKKDKPVGFIARLFNKIKAPAPKQIADKKVTLQIPLELRNSLQQLVEQLSAMDTYSEVASKLTDKVKSLSFVNELAGILELITGVFVEVAGHEHLQFENFLKSLSKRIDRVNNFIDSTVIYSQQVKDESNQLDVELQKSVTSIKTSVENSNSLADVKANIYQKMDSIIARVDGFCQLQNKNHEQLNQNLHQLREQLKATEDESLRLRDELAEQKVRAQTDPLTHLPNRYSYNERLTQEYNRWRRYRSPLSLVIGDIDHFKNINDMHGHAAGDSILKQVANFLQAELRESDFIARFGGEEFVILLPETSLVDAAKAINKLRVGIKKHLIEFEQCEIQVAVSFGISEFENNDTPKAVFGRADKALYRAKEKGRDQVCCQRATATPQTS